MNTIEASIAQYNEAWSVKETEAIKATLKDCWTAESTYTDPQTDLLKGFEGLAAHINGFHKHFIGGKIQQASKADCHHHSGRFKWILTQADGVKIEGMDYFEFNDQNQIIRIVGFFGPFTNL